MRELRLIITSDCNYNCYFCHLEGINRKNIDYTKLLNSEDYGFLFNVFRDNYNNSNITITGGEPLLRKDILDIVKNLKKNLANIIIVTNGSLLDRFQEEFYKYIDRINISLHSTNPEVYNKVTVLGNLDKLMDNIFELRQKNSGIELRLNVALVDNVNFSEKEVNNMVELATKHNLSIKFIELYPKTTHGFVPLKYLEDILKNSIKAEFISNKNRQITYTKNGKYFILTKIFCANAADLGEMICSKFCKSNQDFFITPDGGIKTCMNTNNIISIYDSVKNKNKTLLLSKFGEAINIFGEGCKKFNN